MKKIFSKIAIVIATVAVAASCGKFEPGGTSTQNIAGDWVCTVYVDGGGSFSPYAPCSIQTYNTADNDGSLWIDDFEEFWGTYCCVDGNNSAYTFGKAGKEYEDLYNNVGQMIWGGKVTPGGAISPSGHVTDKIEFFIAFSDDDADDDATTDDAYYTPYYFVGYLQTGIVSDQDADGAYIPKTDWELPSVPEVPAMTEPLPAPAVAP